MWSFLVAILFVVVAVLLLLIFYVGPELAPASIGPTGPTGPSDSDEFEVAAQFLDGSASVASSVAISGSRVKSKVVITVPGFTFDDAANPKTGLILAAAIVPEGFRPTDVVQEMISTVSSGVRKIGLMSINPQGDLSIFVDAQVANLASDALWGAANNSAGQASLTFTTL